MGTSKALLRIKGETFLDHLIGTFLGHLSPVITVLGHEAEPVVQQALSLSRTTVAINPEPERGMLSSLQCGLHQLPATIGGVVFTPVDYPNCQSKTVERIVAAFRCNSCDVVIPVHAGTHGHPVCVSARVIHDLLRLSVTAQARDVIHRFRDSTVFVEVEDPGVALDVDTPEDYRKLVAVS